MGQSSRTPDCLNTIRLVAALQVLYVHSVAHLSLDMPPIVTNVLGFFKGVPIFFTLSGFLIWFSIGRSSSFLDYARKRFWRIFPELWLAVAVEGIVLLFLFDGKVDWTRFALFLLGQGSVFQFWTPEFLRGYGCGVPNGSLWTICVLIQWYAVAYFLHALLSGKSRLRWLLVVGIAAALSVASNFFACESIAWRLYVNSVIPYLWMFLIGAFVAEFKSSIIPAITRYWYVPVALTVVVMSFGLDVGAVKYGVVNTVFIFASCLGMGYAFPKLNITTDISYGIYIYHMTVVNAFISLGLSGAGWTLFAAGVASCFLAWVSTKTIGSYRLKKVARQAS